MFAVNNTMTEVGAGMTVRERVWEIIEVARPGDGLSRGVDAFILTLIFANVIAVIVGSVPSVYARHGDLLDVFELISVAIFSVEYLSRIWACTVDPRFANPVLGRLKFARQPMSIIDLLGSAACGAIRIR